MGDTDKHLQLVLGVVTTNIEWEELSSVRLLSGAVHTLIHCAIATSVEGENDNILIEPTPLSLSLESDVSLSLSLPLSLIHTHTFQSLPAGRSGSQRGPVRNLYPGETVASGMDLTHRLVHWNQSGSQPRPETHTLFQASGHQQLSKAQ